IAKRLNTATETAARRLAHLEADLRAACRPRARIALAPLLRRGQTSAALSISCSSWAAATGTTLTPVVATSHNDRRRGCVRGVARAASATYRDFDGRLINGRGMPESRVQ